MSTRLRRRRVAARCRRSAAPCRSRTRRARRFCMATPAGCVSLSTSTRDRALAARVGDFVDATDAARADIHFLPSSTAPSRDRPACPLAQTSTLKPGGELQLADRYFGCRRLGHLAGVRRKRGILVLLRHALLPCGRRSRLVLRLGVECESCTNCYGDECAHCCHCCPLCLLQEPGGKRKRWRRRQ